MKYYAGLALAVLLCSLALRFELPPLSALGCAIAFIAGSAMGRSEHCAKDDVL